ISVPALDCPAHNQMMRAPAMVAAAAIRRERPAKVAGSKTRDIAGEAQLFHCALEGEHALTEFCQEVGVRTNGCLPRARCLARVQIIPTHLTKEDLTFHTET